MYLLTQTTPKSILRDILIYYGINLPEIFRYSSDFGFGFRSIQTGRKVSHGFSPGENSGASDPKPKFSEVADRKRKPEGPTKICDADK